MYLSPAGLLKGF
nr:unnamed protein product [Callosobruchus analis]